MFSEINMKFFKSVSNNQEVNIASNPLNHIGIEYANFIWNI